MRTSDLELGRRREGLLRQTRLLVDDGDVVPCDPRSEMFGADQSSGKRPRSA